MKSARVFTRENPCTKVELHNCFWLGDGYADRSVVEAKGEIGDNAPKYMVREGFMHLDTAGPVDMYRLTDSGREWLAKGLARYLELHPEKASEVRGRSIPKPPKSTVRRVIRRSRG